MIFHQYTDPSAMYRDTRDLLMVYESQNLILLSNLILGTNGQIRTDWRDPTNWFMAAVSDDTGIQLVALMTPPYNLTLYATRVSLIDDALQCLIDNLDSLGVPIPGIMTEITLARAFKRIHAQNHADSWTVNIRQRIYELTSVNPDIPKIGTLRQAQQADTTFLPGWFDGFYTDCFATPAPPNYGKKCCDLYIPNGRLYVLEIDGHPVSMASDNRHVQTVCGISCVYTPPEFRRHGYASACVAGLSQLTLDRGFKKCALYTDLANPISNSIYQKIGYRPVCDSVDLRLG